MTALLLVLLVALLSVAAVRAVLHWVAVDGGAHRTPAGRDEWGADLPSLPYRLRH
jgi:hypothetical protein